MFWWWTLSSGTWLFWKKNIFTILLHWPSFLMKFSKCVKVEWESYLILPWLDLTSLAANKNCMAQTRRQERFSDRVKAIMATVTFKLYYNSDHEVCHSQPLPGVRSGSPGQWGDSAECWCEGGGWVGSSAGRPGSRGPAGERLGTAGPVIGSFPSPQRPLLPTSGSTRFPSCSSSSGCLWWPGRCWGHHCVSDQQRLEISGWSSVRAGRGPQ